MGFRAATRSRTRRGASAVAAIAVLVALSEPAAADLFHYNSQLLGARAAGMGGAVVGMPEDDASGYYNPAAFFRSDQIKASVSATAFDLQSLTYLDYLGQPASESSVGVIPNASVVSSPWQGGRISFSIFTTDASEMVLDRNLPWNTNGFLVANVRQTQDISTYLLGPTVAMPLSSKLSVGVSVYFVYASQAQLEQVEQVAVSGAAAQHTSETNEISTGVVVVGGVQYQPEGPSGRLTLGVAVRSGASLNDQASSQEQDIAGTAPDAGVLQGTSSSSSTSQQGQGDIPSEVAAGASLRLGPGRVAADVTVYSSEAYTDLGVHVTKALTFNAAAGYEWALASGWTGRVGLYTDRSSAPNLTASTPLSPTPEPHVDYYGATFGLSQLEPHHSLDVALKFAYGYGQAAVEGQVGSFQLTGVRGYDLTLTLGGSFRL